MSKKEHFEGSVEKEANFENKEESSYHMTPYPISSSNTLETFFEDIFTLEKYFLKYVNTQNMIIINKTLNVALKQNNQWTSALRAVRKGFT